MKNEEKHEAESKVLNNLALIQLDVEKYYEHHAQYLEQLLKNAMISHLLIDQFLLVKLQYLLNG